MAFANTDSIVANDVNNMLRGLFKDNSDNAVTGTTDLTNLAQTAIAGGTIGATGSLHIIAAGTTTGTTDTKTIALKFGTVTISTIAIAGGAASDWLIDAWIYNTATGAQRIVLRAFEGASTLETIDVLASSEDTTASVTAKVTGQLGGTTDTITQTIFNIDIVQRT